MHWCQKAVEGENGIEGARDLLERIKEKIKTSEQTGVRYCTRCGAENKNENLFCGKCGRQLDSAD